MPESTPRAGGFREQIERSTRRLAAVPAHARPVLVRRGQQDVAPTEPPPGWLREQIERSTRRLEEVPPYARPVLVRRDQQDVTVPAQSLS